MKAIIFLCALLPGIAHAQFKVDRVYFETLLAQKKYAEVFLECGKKLKEPYAKTERLLYYYMGRSLCGRGHTVQGKEWYKYIRQQLRVDKGFSQELNVAETSCTGNVAAPGPQPSIIIINTSYSPGGGGVTGKGGFTVNCDLKPDESFEKILENDSLEKRLFTADQKEEALHSLRGFLPRDKYVIDTSGRFLVVSNSSSSYQGAAVKKAAAKLEMAYQFFLRHYNFRPTDKLFTVYLLPSRSALRQTAQQVHDIRISDANIGYSLTNDLSLLGVANPNSMGTLFHELFHLVVRSDIGDVSPWLDEGIACLYSVYSEQGNDLVGSDKTWRVSHLKILLQTVAANKLRVPSLEQLLHFNWESFEGGTERKLCTASVHYALSNLFVLYLQQQQQLQAVVAGFKNRQQFSTDSLMPGPPDPVVLEKVLGKPFSSITADFYRWLDEEFNLNMKEILQKRNSGITVNGALVPVMDTISQLLAAIEATPNFVDTSKLNSFKIRFARLRQDYEDESRRDQYIKETQLARLEESDMDDRHTKSGSNERQEAAIRQIETDLDRLKSELLLYLKGKSG